MHSGQSSARRSGTGRARTVLAGAMALAAIGGAAYGIWRLWIRLAREGTAPLAKVVTLAGAGPRVATSAADGDGALYDPFGVAVAGTGAVYVTDGSAGRVFRIDAGTAGDAGGTEAGVRAVPVANGLDMPSAIAVLPDGNLVVANTGAHTIVRIDATSGAVTLLAGGTGERGFSDGAAAAARFDGPIGVDVAADGTVYVADSYNDRIRAIAVDGTVRTVAGGDGTLDTPCGVAVATDGTVYVADTGHGSVARIAADGALSHLPDAEGLDDPTGVAIGADRRLFVADAGGARVWTYELAGANEPGPEATGPRPDPAPVPLAGNGLPGRRDGTLDVAQFSRPTGVAVAPSGFVVVADGTSGAVRAIVPDAFRDGHVVTDAIALLDATEIRAAIPPRWPFDPPGRTREIAATFGEIRTEDRERGVWLHNAVDIPGAPGEVVRAMCSERVTRPIAARGAGERSEFLRLPLVAYVHMRVGRDTNGRALPGTPFELLRDGSGDVVRVRLRRGDRIAAGDPVGTLNAAGHVHLTIGLPGAEVNPLATLALPGFVDTVPPTIESVSVADATGAVLSGSRPGAPLSAAGPVHVLVRAWDRNDRNAERRRLGLYRLGYALLDDAGRLVPGAGGPEPTIAFDRLPRDPAGGTMVYAAGSRSWFSGPTVFVFDVTNVVRDGDAAAGALDLTPLRPGTYTLRVFAEDVSGNRSTRDEPIVVGPPEP